MDASKKYQLIARNLQEIIGEEDLKKKIADKKELSVYWGTMPTGSISIAYFFPMLKIADFLKAGLRVKILLADLHAALDGVPWGELDDRMKYYEKAIKGILTVLDVDLKKLEFVKGSSIQLDKKYFNDLLKLATMTTLNEARHSAAEVVKLGENPKLAGMIYPLMQAIDEEYLKVDMQFGGMDQRKIMVYAREYLPKLGYRPRIELMNPIIRGLVGEKMSSSIENTKIDLLENHESIKNKINKADCVAGEANNGILALIKYLFFARYTDKPKAFVIVRDKKFGGNIDYMTYGDLEKDFVAKKLHPLDVKNALAGEINMLLEPLRADKMLVKLHQKAYKKE